MHTSETPETGPAPTGGGPDATTVTDQLVAANARYAGAFTDPGMDARPVRRVAVVACMDARLDLHKALGLELGDCHTIRNAGGVVTDDVIRSLTISQRALGTRAIVLIHHTGCGLESLTEDFRQDLEREVGQRPSWAVECFTDVDQDVRQSIERVRTSPFLLHRDDVRGFVFDVTTGRLREIAPAFPGGE
ncbi:MULTISPECIES: beta-class carbonic anhydrase [Streptomyces]|uniref:carbonic anhydrase n=1 Tax=Streptomyces cacaoi TaxID=1898 RepID=A0A4Y3R8D3_STRCI|nr:MULTISPECIES: carbonic anhydrase [Streptomyces]NNG89793.1 carbonic anhydrase [Streptomyces cacaoi]QHF93940.1 carbonic anhydrase [Streptomyces sp. NHF165]GEB53891.1 carbonic anhydrase [Streptomyces cacaoi]